MSSESDSTRHALLDTWTQTSSQVFDSVVAANRLALAAFGVGSSVGEADQNGTGTGSVEADSTLPEWHTELAVEGEELGVGDRVEFTKTIAADDLRRFAAASGDTNPLHLDEEFGQETRFRGRIAHGTLVGGLISAALARVPGVVIYLSQDMEFHNPVRVDDRVTAECEIVEDLGNDQFRLSTRVRNDGDVAIDGEAVIMVDDPPE
jgi:3-hydroxybutyryl-CoA dehydratase